jgi:hypothetical protein
MRRHLEQYHPDKIGNAHVNKKARLVLGETDSESLQLQLLDPPVSENGSIVELGGNGFAESSVGRRADRNPDPVPGLSVDTLRSFRVGKPVTHSESGSVRSG